uniref:CRAL-TRIO domain-containing protein n=1 Tax=Favella ehrenbergii TaxID=182087 RepID=A0A7S3I3Q3_9SPIT|mmetsp:Transcript_39631/g.51940  ORF Transcript_39631/g.51940 Transcript_39631/m.51940 type:complete len:154 (+) Transcript_39631:454-915(+)|eukprot:Macronucleus_6398.p1 GENE.Macronucleus_6398~~Macronucleus_6398.p1  ORF type:complete len:154 (+),score=46.34 Macronucleus_6398:1-462(+)
MRPVIIINVRRMIDSRIPVDRLISLTDFFLEYTIAHAMIPGAIESWTCIFDLKDVGVTEIPKDRIQPLVRNMTKNYRGRLFRFYATDVTFIVRQLWKLAHKFVDEFTNKKLLIFGDDYQNEIKELIDEDNLEQRYGGNLPNIERNYFPPQYNP